MTLHKLLIFSLIFLSAFLGLTFLTYLPHYSLSLFLIFSLILFYPFLRLMIDGALLIVSLSLDKQVRYTISILTNNKIPEDKPWKERFLGIFKWLVGYWSILCIEFVTYLFLIRSPI